MHKTERQSLLILSCIMAFRMLGIFMILPVFAVAAKQLAGANAWRVGLAIGVYGLTQACLQIPFGRWSDRVGRLRVLVVGLLLFFLGSVVAAMSHHIVGVIAGRLLQGAGAIGSTALATMADFTRDEYRTRAMALLGMVIGCAFFAAMFLGPLIYAASSLSGIFWVTALFAVVGLGLLRALPRIPTPLHDPTIHIATHTFSRLLRDAALWRLNVSIFMQHLILTLLFLVLPVFLMHRLHVTTIKQTVFYALVLVMGFLIMMPFVVIAEKRRHIKGLGVAAIALMAVVLLLGATTALLGLVPLAIGLCLFFAAFSFMESCLPSLVAKFAPIRARGSAMGLYSSAQFLGIFVGGALGGWLIAGSGEQVALLIAGVFGLIWVVVWVSLPTIRYLSTQFIPLTAAPPSGASAFKCLAEKPGIHEYHWLSEANLLIIKIDKQEMSIGELRNLLEQSNLTPL